MYQSPWQRSGRFVNVSFIFVHLVQSSCICNMKIHILDNCSQSIYVEEVSVFPLVWNCFSSRISHLYLFYDQDVNSFGVSSSCTQSIMSTRFLYSHWFNIFFFVFHICICKDVNSFGVSSSRTQSIMSRRLRSDFPNGPTLLCMNMEPEYKINPTWLVYLIKWIAFSWEEIQKISTDLIIRQILWE